MTERKIRKPSKVPSTCTITFDLLGDDDERLSQYMWLKAEEKTTIAALMQAMFECETGGKKLDSLIEYYDGLLTPDDLPVYLKKFPVTSA